MEDLKILTVTDLLRYGRPHTGSSIPGSPIISYHNPQPPPSPCTSNPNQDCKPLTQFEYPAILVGTLRLPTQTLKCPHQNCLEFADDSVAVCCDIIGLDLRIIGKKLDVLAWNFIPSDHLAGGFLEIVKWNLQNSSRGISRCSNLMIDSFPLVPNFIESIPSSSIAKSYRIHGIIAAVSPVSVVPCSVNDSSSSKSMNLRGFHLKIMTCECRLCYSKESVSVLYGASARHSFTEPVFVYFCGTAWCWHLVMMKLIGNVVTISGLSKKLVFMGKQESDLIFVTVENTVLHLPRLLKKRKVVCGSYKGIVKNVYMQGMAIELDKEVWLLLTSQSHMPPHGLRIGAVISVRNVHFVVPKFPWSKFLVLGACSRTSITVKSFSQLKTGCLIASKSQSKLEKFIEMLAFSARLWVLLLVSCFKKKFSGILSTRKILGSTHKEGLVQMFANSHLSSSVFRARHGVLMEFSKHESCCCSANEPYHGNLKLVIPISSFIHHCEVFWMKMLLPSDNILPMSCEGKYYQRSISKAFQSEDLGIILVGMLKICPSSGRLQLVDMTGSIDVVIPDLPSFWNPNAIFEVIDYYLVVEGMPESIHSGLSSNDSLLPGSIFRGFQSARKTNLKIFVYFHLCNATCRNRAIYPSVYSEDELNEIESGKFHLIYVNHKFHPPCHSIKLERSVFADAIVLPWHLFLAGNDGSLPQDKASRDCNVGNHADHSTSKRQRTDCISSRFTPNVDDNFCSASFEKGTSLQETCGDQSCLGTRFSHEIPCFATIRGVNNFISTSSGTLYRTKTDVKTKVCKGSVKKIFLEFTSESDLKYQLLQIGGFYLMKHHKEGPLCNIKDADLIGVKVPMTSGTYLRRLSFSSEVPTTDKSLHDSSQCNDVFTKDQVLGVPSDSSLSNVHLHVSSSLTSLLEIDTKELGNGQNAPGANLENSSLSLGVNLDENSGSLGHSCLFPDKSFTSLRGDIIAVHSFDKGSSDMCASRNYGDLHQYQFCDRTKGCCIHVLVANENVKIIGPVDQHLFPTGFGPGINATFHRVLELRVPGILMLMSVSSIVINSIRAINEAHISDGNLNRFRCRVVAVHVLVLEKSNRKCDDLKSNMHSRHLSIDIPLACFILEDGSSSWCCWANAERAATLLRLQEYQLSGCEASGHKRWVGMQNTVRTSMYHLQGMLEKHDRLTVKNIRSIYDPFDQDFAVTVSSGRALTGLDEDFNLLVSIIFNACINTFWTVVAEDLDSNAVNLLKEHLDEMQMPMPPMENLWAKEVCYVNKLNEARDMMQLLVKR